jgi:hypothetical protein
MEGRYGKLWVEREIDFINGTTIFKVLVESILAGGMEKPIDFVWCDSAPPPPQATDISHGFLIATLLTFWAVEFFIMGGVVLWIGHCLAVSST